MAATTTTSFPVPATAPAKSVSLAGTHRRRRISPESGRALEILGHAIEYLTDEFVHDGADLTANSPQLEAVRLLMSVNRRVYFECPEIPSLWERFSAFLGGRAV
jgi:hypothetical protein